MFSQCIMDAKQMFIRWLSLENSYEPIFSEYILVVSNRMDFVFYIVSLKKLF
jgi:hypothetical protein